MNIIAKPLDSLLVFAASVLLVAQVMSLRWGFRLMNQLRTPEPGGQLLRILVTVATLVAGAQVVVVGSFILLAADRYGSVDARVGLFLIAEIMLSGTIIWSMWRLRRMG